MQMCKREREKKKRACVCCMKRKPLMVLKNVWWALFKKLKFTENLPALLVLRTASVEDVLITIGDEVILSLLTSPASPAVRDNRRRLILRKVRKIHRLVHSIVREVKSVWTDAGLSAGDGSVGVCFSVSGFEGEIGVAGVDYYDV